MLAVATLIAVLDSIASQVDKLEDALGVVGNEAGTISAAAASNRDVIAALDDYTVQRDLSQVFSQRAVLTRAAVFYGGLQGAMVQRALDVHLGGYSGSLNRFLTENDARVHPNLRLIGMQIDSRNTFAPTAVDPVARYDGTGAGAGTFVAGSDIDLQLYGEAKMEVVVEAMGAAQRTIRLAMRNFDNSTENKDVVIPGNTAPGTTLAIGAVNDRYVGVSSITTIDGGGTAADRTRVRSIVERALPPL